MLTVLAGGAGESAPHGDTGGGSGASFVYFSGREVVPLAIAGGGGSFVNTRIAPFVSPSEIALLTTRGDGSVTISWELPDLPVGVPAPGGLALFGLAALGLGLARRVACAPGG